MKRLIISLLFFVLFIPVNAQNKKELKKQKAAEEYTTTKKLINSKKFIFEADWATSQGGRRINLMSNPNFIKVDNDKTIADMPYFGVAQTAVGIMNGDAGVKFDTSPRGYKVDFNDKKQRITIKFDADNKSENFNVTMHVYKSGNASVTITSSSRNSISYDGKIAALKE